VFRKSLVVLIAAGLLAMLVLTGMAIFTSTATVSNNTFTTGTLVLTASPTSTAITYSNMAPGDQVTAPIAMNNTGSLDLRYAMTSTSTNTDGKNLANQLVLQIKSGVTTCTNAGFGASGTQVYSGTLASAAFGNPAQGQQAGDRALTAGTNETLCFNASLPLATDNTFQNATTTATLTFSGEQTANNP
jgi:Camelysin metallo-endopeptidase